MSKELAQRHLDRFYELASRIQSLRQAQDQAGLEEPALIAELCREQREAHRELSAVLNAEQSQ